jgi:hypothetical protein
MLLKLIAYNDWHVPTFAKFAGHARLLPSPFLCVGMLPKQGLCGSRSRWGLDCDVA